MTADRARIAAALPQYSVGEEIGRGAWGVVLAGEHRALGRPVAIKVLAEHLAGDPSVQARFGTEARVLAALDHPHIVRIFDYVEEGSLCLFVMDLLPGGTLRTLLSTQGVSAEVACSLALAAASALHHAHLAGVLHRDIKPENLMFAASGMLRVTDFGIAKLLGSAAGMTRAGEVFGTAAYMAPEQIMGGTLGPATDVYALGTVLYEALAGRLPFPEDENPMTVLYRHVNEAPAPLQQVAPWVPPEVAEVVMRAVSAAVGERHPDAEEFGVALAEAALRAWGAGWVGRTGVEVVSSGRIAARISASGQGFPALAGGAARPRAGGGRLSAVRRRPRLALAAAGAVAALAVVVAVAATGGGGGGATGAPASAAASATATATASPPASPAPAGRQVFADDAMNDPTSGWAPDPGQGDNGRADARPDGYHVVALKPNTAPLTTFSAASPFALRLTSMVVEVQALVTGSPRDGAGVRCDQGGGRNGLRYTFEIHGDGSWVVFKIDQQGSTALAQGTSPAIRAPGGVNTIRGQCTEAAGGGSTALTMTVNGVRLAQVGDDHPGPVISWHSALVVYRDPASPSTDVRYTRFRVLDAGA